MSMSRPRTPRARSWTPWAPQPPRSSSSWCRSATNDECKSMLCKAGICDSCTSDGDCAAGSCVEGSCTAAGAKATRSRGRRLWLGVHVAGDIALVGGKDVCSPDGQITRGSPCYYEGTNKPYIYAAPFPGQLDRIGSGF